MPTPAEILAESLQALRNAKRFSHTSNSYRKDNPGEYAKVIAYLDGGTRPTGTLTEMGKHAVLDEDARRALTPPDPDPDPDPGPWTGPLTITAGGTYSGSWESTAAGTPCITINTSQPVTITGRVRKLTTGDGAGMIYMAPGVGARVTVRNLFAYGAVGGFQRFVKAEEVNALTVENCTIDRTGGIECKASRVGAVVLIARNKCMNIQGQQSPIIHRQFIQFNNITGGTCIVEWNEVVNEYGKSRIEDCFSAYKTNGVIFRNNCVKGGYPTLAGDGHSGCGFICGDDGGSNNKVHDNHVIGYTNAGISISSGSGNQVYNNRVVSDGFTDTGVELWATNQGLICYTTTPGQNNKLYGNYVGWMQGQRFGHPLSRSDFYCPTADNNVNADNTFAYGNHSTPITAQDEAAEWTRWQAKVAASGIAIGA